MELSKYNIYSQKNNTITIFNTFSSALIQLDEESFKNLLTDKNDSNLTCKLLDMGILIRCREDEIRKYKYIQYSRMFRNNQILLYICPTMNCNFSCSYCFEAGNKKESNMSPEVEDAIVRFISKNKDKKIFLTWFGGEPLLNLKTIKNITDKLREMSIKYSSSLITNGSLLTKQAIDILKNIPIEFIQISIDGTKDTHDKRRYLHSGRGTFDTIIKGMKRVLNETSIPITIQVAIDKTNYQEYEKLISYFNEQFFPFIESKRIQLNFNIIKDRTNFDKYGICMNHQDYFHYLIHLKKLKIANTVNISLPAMAQPCMYNSVGSYAITPDGEIYKCIEHAGNIKKSVGNIFQENNRIKRRIKRI